MDAARRGVGLCIFILFMGTIGCGQAHTTVDAMTGERAQQDDENVSQVADESTQGPFEQPKGFYSEGKLINATNLGFSGPGFIKLFVHRDTGWASFDLIAVIKKAINSLNRVYPNSEPVQIGDIAGRNGGQLGGHASHQNGLDADVRFLARNHHIQSPEIRSGFDESYVKKGVVSGNFDLERNWLLIKALVKSGRINRIFADGAIKKALCLHARKTNDLASGTEALRRVQAYPDHTDHMHVRVTCPRASPACQNQNQPPKDLGC